MVSKPELENLSTIFRTFNEKYGKQFSDDDKVKKMTQDLMQDVANDQEFVNAFIHSDQQNTKTTFDKVLEEKLINHINTNFEVFKMFIDNPEFRQDLTELLFRDIVKDFGKLNMAK